MTEKTPFLSVIIPFYNVEDWLPRSIDSVLSQTFRDYEVILVDDGSTDRSGEIADGYAAKYDAVHVIHNAHSGVGHARNAGLSAAAGTFIHFMDSDDYIDPDMYRILVELTQNMHADIAACRFKDIYQNRTISSQEDGTVRTLLPEEAYEQILTRKMDDSLCTKLIRRALFEGIDFREGKHYEDVLIMPQLLMKANRIVQINRGLYNYYHRLNSITTSPDPARCADIIETSDQILSQAPASLKEAARFRCYASRFGVLDLVMMEGDPADFPQYKELVQYLQDHWYDIVHCPYFKRTRRIAALVLRISPRLYKGLIALKWKTKAYHSASTNQ